MTALTLSFVRHASVPGPILAVATSLAGFFAVRFRRSLDIRVDEQSLRMERTGLAGMI